MGEMPVWSCRAAAAELQLYSILDVGEEKKVRHVALVRW